MSSQPNHDDDEVNDCQEEWTDYRENLINVCNDRGYWFKNEVKTVQSMQSKLMDDVDQCPPFNAVNYFKNMIDTYWVVTYYHPDNEDVTLYYSIEEYSYKRLRRIWDAKHDQLKQLKQKQLKQKQLKQKQR